MFVEKSLWITPLFAEKTIVDHTTVFGSFDDPFKSKCISKGWWICSFDPIAGIEMALPGGWPVKQSSTWDLLRKKVRGEKNPIHKNERASFKSGLWWDFCEGHAHAFFNWFFRVPMAIFESFDSWYSKRARHVSAQLHQCNLEGDVSSTYRDTAQ